MNNITTNFKEWIEFVVFDDTEDIYNLYVAVKEHKQAGKFNCEEKREELLVTNLLLLEKQLVLKGVGIGCFLAWLSGFFAAKTNGENIEDWEKSKNKLLKMKVLMLAGPSHSGKTTTIKMVYEELKEKYGAKDKKLLKKAGKDDIEAVLKCKGKTVGIASMGDCSSYVIHYMSFYEGMGCDVLVCACRDYFNIPFKRLESRYHNINPPILKKAANDDDNSRAVNEIISQI